MFSRLCKFQNVTCLVNQSIWLYSSVFVLLFSPMRIKIRFVFRLRLSKYDVRGTKIPRTFDKHLRSSNRTSTDRVLSVCQKKPEKVP